MRTMRASTALLLLYTTHVAYWCTHDVRAEVVAEEMQLALLIVWFELAISAGTTPIVLVLLYVLFTSSIHKGCKVVLIMNGLGLLALTTSQLSIAVYRLQFPGVWKAHDTVSNVPLFLHQLAYCSCTAAMLLTRIERTIIGLKPRLYADKRVSQWSIVVICVLAEANSKCCGMVSCVQLNAKNVRFLMGTSSLQALVALPCAMLMQDGPTINRHKLYSTSKMKQNTSLLLLALVDCLDVILVCFSFRRSTVRYNEVFATSTLRTRYQAKEVKSLTRVLFPICCSSLVVRFTVIVLAYFAFGDDNLVDIFFTIIRFCCTIEAIVESILLLSRHHLVRRRVIQLLGLPMREVKVGIGRDPAAIADAYFDMFKQELEAKFESSGKDLKSKRNAAATHNSHTII